MSYNYKYKYIDVSVHLFFFYSYHLINEISNIIGIYQHTSIIAVQLMDKTIKGSNGVKLSNQESETITATKVN